MIKKENLYKLDELFFRWYIYKRRRYTNTFKYRKVKGIRERKQFIPRWFNGRREI